MEVKNKIQPDPVAELSMADVYMLWALQAAEEVVGKQGLNVVLREVKLERLIDNYPPNAVSLSFNLKASDYSDLFAGLLQFYGRAGKSILLRIGRVSARLAREQQGALFNIGAVTAVRLLPLGMQIKSNMEYIQGGFRKIWHSFGQDMKLRNEDRGDRFAYIAETCPMCAGKQADANMCLSFTGTLNDGLQWLTGKEFEISEVECRAQGALACVWEISKTPKEA